MAKNSIFILFAILIVAGIVLYSSGGFQAASATIGGGSTGFTLNSIDLLDESGRSVIVSKDSDLSALNWVINLTANGGGQSLTGTISKDQIFDRENVANNPLSITIDAVDETVEYKTSGMPTNVYEYYLTTGKNIACEPTHLVYQFRQADTVYGIPTGSYTTYCVRRDIVANSYNIDTPTVKNQATMTLKIGNTSITQTVGNISEGVRFESGGQLYAVAESNGFLVSGNSPPSAAVFRAMYNIDLPQYQNKWHSIRAETLTAYTDKASELETALKKLHDETGGLLDSGWIVSYYLPSTAGSCKSSGGVNCENMFKSMFELANQNGKIAGSEDVSFGQTLGSRFAGSESSAVLSQKFDASILKQSITLYVKADKLGIVFPESKGEIASLSCPDFVSNFRGTIQVAVRNTGSEAAPYELRLGSCGFSLEEVLSQFTVPAGQTITKNIYIHNVTVAGEQSSLCTVELYDTFGKFLSKEDITCKQLPPSECLNADKKAQGNCLLKCVSGNWAQEMCCKINEDLKFSGGSWICIEQVPPQTCGDGVCAGGEIITCPQDCCTGANCGACANGCARDSQGNCPASCGGELTCEWYEVNKETQTAEYGALPAFGAMLLNWGFNIKVGVINECVINPLLIIGIFAVIIIAIVAILMMPKKGRGRRR